MKQLHTLTLFLCAFIAATSQPAINWQQSYGGSDFDVPSVIRATPDGGMIVAATSFSPDNDATGNHGVDDIMLVKLNATRSVEWRKVLGGSNEDGVHDLQLTNDGGFIVAGFTKSNDGDVSGLKGGTDYWVIKLNAAGVVIWQNTYGGTNGEVASSVKQTEDGGYIVAGYTTSNNGQVTNNHSAGIQDAWITKLDPSGQLEWQKCYGGTDAEFAYDIDLAPGGYIFSGYARSADGDIAVNKGGQDAWIVKLDFAGNIQWQLVLGGSKNEAGYKIKKFPGGGYIMAGSSNSKDGDVFGQHGQADGWLINISESGTVEWKRCYGGSSLESFRDVIHVIGGFWVIGSAESTDHDVKANKGKSDYWILQLDINGEINWQTNAGGTDIDDGFAACLLPGGELVFAGSSFSRDNDVKQWLDAGDVWIFSLKENKPLPVITKQPVDASACNETFAGFSLEEIHSTAYQWQVLVGDAWMNLTDGISYLGTQTKALVVKAHNSLNSFQYRCVLSNERGITNSDTVKLEILYIPVISTHPASSTACPGRMVELTITATRAIKFQWQENKGSGSGWQNIAGALQSTYNFMVHNVGSQFRCIAFNDCGSDTSQVAEIPSSNCSITNAFSPNSDGINDRWYLPLLADFPACSVLVFDRYGKKVFESRGYTVPWDGRFNGKTLPAGVYYFLLDLRDGSKPLNGSLTLLY